MTDREGCIDVLADLRCLQDPLYADRGIGSHASFLLQTLRDRSAGRLRLVGLVDPAAPPPAACVAETCDELRVPSSPIRPTPGRCSSPSHQ